MGWRGPYGTAQNQPSLQERPIKAAAVVADQHTGLADALTDRPQECLLLVEVAQKVLGEGQAVPVTPGETDQKSDRASAAGQPGRFRVQEEWSPQLVRRESQAGRKRADLRAAVVGKPLSAE